jgi:hypothetical protein
MSGHALPGRLIAVEGLDGSGKSGQRTVRHRQPLRHFGRRKRRVHDLVIPEHVERRAARSGRGSRVQRTPVPPPAPRHRGFR